jgi:citrate synthase
LIELINIKNRAMPDRDQLDAAAAARRLGVSRATLYAYVSRGLIAATAHPDDPRRRLYRQSDVERLRRGKSQSRRPRDVAARSLDWGLGALPSSITLIDDGRIHYRGRDAAALAEVATLEEVARLLWNCGDVDPFRHPPGRAVRRPAGLGKLEPLNRCRALLALLAPQVPATWGRQSSRLWSDGALVLRALTAAALDVAPAAAPIHEQLAAVWRLDRAGAALVRAALVLLADHELNASTFAARVVASTGASLAAAVSAGLAALQGPRHGGATALVEALFEEMERRNDAEAAVRHWLDRAEALAGFGHPLYPDGDPRARYLLARLAPDPARERLLAAVDAFAGARPNIDFALVALRRSLGLPPGAAITIFAVARSVGWIAHALEQHLEGKLIRPRAEYVGPPPAT